MITFLLGYLGAGLLTLFYAAWEDAAKEEWKTEWIITAMLLWPLAWAVAVCRLTIKAGHAAQHKKVTPS